MTQQREPHDDHVYPLMVHAETLNFFLDALKFYEALLKSDVDAIDADPDLGALLGKEEKSTFPVYRELARVGHVRQWLEPEKGMPFCGVQWTHGFVRYLKSVASLYLKRLRQRRDALARRANVSKHALQTVDTRISKLDEKIKAGVFQGASCIPLLVDEVVEQDGAVADSQSEVLAKAPHPRPIVLASIEILDSDIRARCLDLFNKFEEGQQRDRHDTVVTEATRILENRIRLLCGARQECVGVALATFAFGTQSPRLRLSTVAAEQEAAHALYRGAFGFIRNQVHHRLSGELSPERVLQVLGFIDYLIALAEGAESRPSDPP